MNGTLWAIIAAGGVGARMGSSIPKQFIHVGGKPVLGLTLERLMSSPLVSGAVVVLPLEWFDRGEEAIRRYSRGKPVRAVQGGSTRQESVRAGLACVPQEASWVLVHDASRPNVSVELVREVAEKAFQTGAAISCVPIYDALKSLGNDRVAKVTPRREELLAVQTPQVFARDLLTRAHLAALRDNYTGQDDSELVERLGHPVALVRGSRLNFKITTPEDLVMQEALERYRRVTAGEYGPFRPVRRYGRPVRREGLVSQPARTGIGFDVHRFAGDRPCILGGVTVPGHPGLEGHSDGDVLCHAVMDALLGAAGEKDIGHWFPPGDPRYEGAFSLGLLSELWKVLSRRWQAINVDATVIAEVPRISPYCDLMRENIAHALELDRSSVSVKATTPEKMGALGQKEGIACVAVACLTRRC
ncbi:MAG: 2-C-methyl-D-erythritol 4-phosphate cytidylyltransferase [Firmicutes bacterium]|nr:2-C-methyl-D-erythritol 4-phosphate cytidylyltransferase [Candidatus Fermentithermobacillaceae bacterium]